MTEITPPGLAAAMQAEKRQNLLVVFALVLAILSFGIMLWTNGAYTADKVAMNTRITDLQAAHEKRILDLLTEQERRIEVYREHVSVLDVRMSRVDSRLERAGFQRSTEVDENGE